MEFIRKIIDSDDLTSVINLPQELKHKKVELLILPLEDQTDKKENNSLKGILNEYSNPKLRDKEEKAWQMAVEEKHDNS